MLQQDDTRLRAFNDARKLISVSRAKEILRWKNWRHGGVLGGASQPSCPDITDEEDQVVRRLWMTLDGSRCWMSALYMLYNDERPTGP
jgi:hypothetical protein